MSKTGITKRRVRQFIERVGTSYYSDTQPLSAEYISHKKPIPYDTLSGRRFRPIAVGTLWGKQWDSAWFRFTGAVPPEWRGSEVVGLIDVGAEGCVFRDGVPWIGLTYKLIGDDLHVKRRVPIGVVEGHEQVEWLVEAAANGLFGAHPTDDVYQLHEAQLAVLDRRVWQLYLDLEFLLDLAGSLPEDSTRARRIYCGLNEAANVWSGGAGLAAAKKITEGLLKTRANASAPTAWSVGHAHLDLGWLWPVRETRRKGGRTFATALRLLEEYPDYVFGASQPQLFDWIKHDYPSLYEEVKHAVAGGRWEVQGAMWVEPDMNLTSGESLVRQCLYGKRFYRQEFGIDVKNLWLPDVFGYSAALPQILTKAGVDIFMTQKISWNETNVFPHHSFMWEGIDGTAIRTHFLPTNDYNLSNEPHKLVAAEKRFGQSGSLDDFLNLYGTGDGGGGPSRKHIERARRAADTEGMPKVKMAPGESFFERLRKTSEANLPRWRGELYLELHRGTYTTQALMKKMNRRLEHLLHDVELLSVIAAVSKGGAGAVAYDNAARNEIERIWKETLLNQFHDILPGSSITWVYKDAHAVSEANVAGLQNMRDRLLAELTGSKAKQVTELTADAKPLEAKSLPSRYVVFNTLSWARRVTVAFKTTGTPDVAVRTVERSECAASRDGELLYATVPVPSAGYTVVTLDAPEDLSTVSSGGDVRATDTTLENGILRVRLDRDGTVTSLYRKDLKREYTSGAANRFTLWEDLPYSWDAWDISDYYRETVPEQARLVESSVLVNTETYAAVRQTFAVGDSTIEQVLSLESRSPVVRADCRVDWREIRKHLRVGAQADIQSESARYEIQFGTVHRPTHTNTSWDEARFEVAAHRFADLSQPDAGLALLNDCKYGHRIIGRDVELTLLRSSKYPDAEADMGEHTFSFAYMPHAGRSDESEVLRRAHELNAPAVVVARPSKRFLEHTDGEEQRHSYFDLDSSSVKLDGVKPAEDGNGIIVRLYETCGADAKTILFVPKRFKTAVETDLLETDGDTVAIKASGQSSEVFLTFGPFEIRTLRLI